MVSCTPAFDGLPMAHPGHIDVVYDTVAKPETFEVGVRVLAERGRLVYTGVAVPGRWEWTPVYFKELTIVGSNAFAMEEFEGVRKHAIDHYLSLVQAGRIDLTGMVTHRYPLEDWWDALTALSRPADSGVVKATFTPNRGLTGRWPAAPRSARRAQGLELLEARRGGGRPCRIRFDPPTGARPRPGAVEGGRRAGRHAGQVGGTEGGSLGHAHRLHRQPGGIGHRLHPREGARPAAGGHDPVHRCGRAVRPCAG